MIATKNDLDAPAKRPRGRLWLGISGFVLAAGVFVAVCYYLKHQHASAWLLMAAAAVYALAMLGLANYTSSMMRQCSTVSPSGAARRYRSRFNIAMAIYVVALIGSLSLVIQYHLTGPVAYGMAILPALPLLSVIVIMGVYLREETDEFERSIQAEAALWASGGLLAVETVWGFMELFDLVPHIQIWWAFPIWAFLLAPGNIIARRRYR